MDLLASAGTRWGSRDGKALSLCKLNQHLSCRVGWRGVHTV